MNKLLCIAIVSLIGLKGFSQNTQQGKNDNHVKVTNRKSENNSGIRLIDVKQAKELGLSSTSIKSIQFEGQEIKGQEIANLVEEGKLSLSDLHLKADPTEKTICFIAASNKALLIYPQK